MEFPKFDDFKNLVLKEEIMDQIIGYKEKREVFQVDLSKSENIGAFVSKLIQDTESESVAISFRILEAYHIWLYKCLNGQ